MTTIKRAAQSPRHLVVLFTLTVALATALHAVTESATIPDALYWTVTTMTTVGYGDLSPTSVGGRMLTSVLMLWSVFVLVPLCVTNLMEWLRPTA